MPRPKKETKPAAEKRQPVTASTKSPSQVKSVGQVANRSELIARAMNDACGYDAVFTVKNTGHTSRLRRPSFITGLDLDTGGGLPADGVTLIVGPEGAGKTTLLYYYYAAHQLLYGEDASILHVYVENKPDYFLMRKVGCRVGLPDVTLNDLEEERRQLGQPPLSMEDRGKLLEQTGVFHITTAASGEDVFTLILKALASKHYHIVGLDSMSVLTSADEYDKEMDEKEKMAARALLKRKFFDRYYRLNRIGTQNETTFITTGQVRADMAAGQFGRQFKNQDGYAVKHGNSITIIVESGEKIRSSKTADKGEMIGKFFKWETLKGKEGSTEGSRGKVPFIFHEPFEMKSMIDLNETIIEPAYRLGLLFENKDGLLFRDGAGGVLVGGIKGTKEFVRMLDEDPALAIEVRRIINNKAGLPCLFKRNP